jgi:hypothetical protein
MYILTGFELSPPNFISQKVISALRTEPGQQRLAAHPQLYPWT